MASEDTKKHKTKFAADIEKAWQGACQIYLTQSGIDPHSQEWKFVKDTTHPQQVIDVIIETWAHYRNPSKSPASEVARSTIALSSRPKMNGFIASSKKGFNRLIGRNQSGLIIPVHSPHGPLHTTIDDRVNLQQKLSANPPNGKDFIDTGLAVTDQIQALNDSNVKTIVDAVVKFSDGLQALASVSETVLFL